MLRKQTVLLQIVHYERIVADIEQSEWHNYFPQSKWSSQYNKIWHKPAHYGPDKNWLFWIFRKKSIEATQSLQMVEI